MTYTIIEVPDLNDSMSRVVLNGTAYIIRFTYNDTMDYWSFGLYDSQKEPLALGIKLVPGMVLNLFFGAKELPYGAFGVRTSLEQIGREAFTDGDAEFIFAPYEDA